uniref:Uncharacterized protein n=1 Tax=Anguilla anguilla TaxID=7936 RepID=A0A0E9U5M4_ANGAN
MCMTDCKDSGKNTFTSSPQTN